MRFNINTLDEGWYRANLTVNRPTDTVDYLYEFAFRVDRTAPNAPTIVSLSHPTENDYYSENYVTFQLNESSSDLTGFQYAVYSFSYSVGY